MPSPSVTVFRACAAAGLGAVIAVGAWAAPTQQVPGPSVAAEAPSDPVVTVPELGAGVEPVEQAASQVSKPDPVSAVESHPSTPQPRITPSAATPTEPDHLAPVADDTPAPEPVVTTTTTVAPPPTTTVASAPVATVAFSANQAYGSCGEAVPYDIFSGTATPGSAISISSPHGSGSTTADASGHWSVTVEFPSAPRGEAFTVTASGLGGSKTFGFTATGGPHA